MCLYPPWDIVIQIVPEGVVQSDDCRVMGEHVISTVQQCAGDNQIKTQLIRTKGYLEYGFTGLDIRVRVGMHGKV